MEADFFLHAAAISLTAVMCFLAGAALMGVVLRRTIEAERQKLRECLDRGNRLVHTGEDMFRRMRHTL
jgi:hypothetical protein